jgi:hypothetical protein
MAFVFLPKLGFHLRTRSFDKFHVVLIAKAEAAPAGTIASCLSLMIRLWEINKYYGLQ